MAVRQTALTPDVHDLIVKLVSGGNSIKSAAAMAGVTVGTVNAWMYRGNNSDEEPFTSFAVDIASAAARCENDLLENVFAAAKIPEQWKANEFLLKAMSPARYAEKIKLEVESNTNELLNRLERGLTDIEFQKVLEILQPENEHVVPQLVEATVASIATRSSEDGEEASAGSDR